MSELSDTDDLYQRLYEKIRREGEAANDHNRRVYRLGRGVLLRNPYTGKNAAAAEVWEQGYQYRDMVNDG